MQVSYKAHISLFDLPILVGHTEPTSLDDNNHHGLESARGNRRKTDNYTPLKLEFPFAAEFGLFVGPRWLLLPGQELSAPAWARGSQALLFGSYRFVYGIGITYNE